MKLTPQQLGGRARAEKALAAYLANPRICRGCEKPILPEPGRPIKNVARLTYCSRTCANGVNNRLQPKRKKRVKSCVLCGASFVEGNARRKFCAACLPAYRESFGNREKREVTRRVIYAHSAAVIAGRPKQCVRCGYSLFVDICRVRPIRDFPETAKVREINDPANLIYLCPNCHHEFDAGLLPGLTSSGGGT